MIRFTRIAFALALAAAFAASGCSKKTMADSGPANPVGPSTPGSAPDNGNKPGNSSNDPNKGSGETGQHIWQDVRFAYDDASLDAESKTQLAGDGDYLTKHTTVQVTIEGHCDERGSVEYNQALGEQRANSVRAYLTSYGVPDEARLHTISYGKMKPIDQGHDETAYARNRRVHFVEGSR